MASMIERPSFYEGQILAGGDLNASVEHARGQAARHHRYLHLWGIAEGLDLKGEDKSIQGANNSKTAYQEITVSAGIAVDASGREIVLPADTRLPEQAFDQSNVWVGQAADDTVLYPVFLTGRDSVAPPSAFATGQCGANEPNRFREDIQFEFGRPGDETTAAEQSATAIAEGPDSGQAEPRRVLLGFVAWNRTINKFVKSAPDHNGTSRPYAGVRADTVAARGGRLALRTRSLVTKGKPGLEMRDADGLLAYGALTAAGEVEPVFSVNAKGDLKITGKFTSAGAPGSVQVQSGVAMDGVILPLPYGISQEMLDKGQATVHVQATMRVPPSLPPDAANPWFAIPLEVSVDKWRRLRCTARWLQAAGGTGMADLPGQCDYLVTVSVAAA